MKKPREWETFSAYILNAFIHELNVWNANQPISDAEHSKHYKEEIQPLIKRRDYLQSLWVRKK